MGRSNWSVLHTFEDSDAVLAVAFSPDGFHVVSGNAGKTMKLWDLATGQLLRSFDSNSVASVAFSRDGNRMVTAGHKQTPNPFWPNTPPCSLYNFNCAPIIFTPLMMVWDGTTGQQLMAFTGVSDTVYSVAFSPDGTRILSGSDDKTMKLRDAATGQILLTFEGHSDSVRSVAFSPDGTRVLSGSQDKTMKLWNAATGQLLLTFNG